MNQIIILVEGATEEGFVTEVLRPYLLQFNTWVTPTIINTKIVKSGPNHKGGSVYFSKVQRDLQRLLKDKSVRVTTFFDFYGLGTDFPKQAQMPTLGSIYDRIHFLETAFEEAINNPNFKAYFQPYEFEGLLFADIKAFENLFSDNPVFVEGVRQIINDYPNPEEINDGAQTAPSKRLDALLNKKYEKIFHGNMIALENGIEVLLSKCTHFRIWVNWLADGKILTA